MKNFIHHWETNKEVVSKENHRFIKRMKSHAPDHLNELAETIHDEVFSEINCLECANCCKVVNIVLTEEDVRRIGDFLQKDLLADLENIIEMGSEKEYLINTTPCPFLGDDNACTVYKVRPDACREFPHFKGKAIEGRAYLHAYNTEICPATYHILERLKESVRYL